MAISSYLFEGALALCIAAVLYTEIEPFPEGIVHTLQNATKSFAAGSNVSTGNAPGRQSVSQQMMLASRCFVLPAVALANLLQPRPRKETGNGRGLIRFLSVGMTTLWPRTIHRHNLMENVWSWIPLFLMNFNRSVLGLLDAWERQRIGMDHGSWTHVWRLWQHITGMVSILIGYRFFHAEPGKGYWRTLRNPYGVVRHRRSSADAMFVLTIYMYVADAALDAFLQPISLQFPFVVGFSRHVLWSLCNPRDYTSGFVMTLMLSCCWFRWRKWPFEEELVKVLQAVMSYVILCCNHHFSASILCYVICVECRRLEDTVLAWGKENILAESTVVVHFMYGEIGWELEETTPLTIGAVLEGSPAHAAQILPGARLEKINGTYVFTKSEAEVLIEPGQTLKITTSGARLPRDSDRRFLKLREEVANGARRLCPLIYYVFLDTCMYFLTDFSQSRDMMHRVFLVQLLLRHLPPCALVLTAVHRISCFNGAVRKLRRYLNEAASHEEWSEKRVHQFETFRSLMDDNTPLMSMYIFGIAVDQRFLYTTATLAVQYIGLGPTILKFVGLGDLILSKDSVCQAES